MNQIILDKPITGNKVTQQHWKDFAGLSWILLDDDLANFHLTK